MQASGSDLRRYIHIVKDILMAPKEQKTFKVENARLIFKNFSGKIGPYNAAGAKQFCVILPEEDALVLNELGWNAKQLKSREEGEEGDWYIEVTVKFDVKPPRIVMISSTARTTLTDATVEVLDYADIKNVDLICNGYDWNVHGKEGTSAYLKTMFVTIHEDDLERKYAEVMEEN